MNKIDYDNCIVNLTNSIMKYFGLEPYHKTLLNIDKILEKGNYQNVVVLLCDGMGSKNLSKYLAKDDFLRVKKQSDLMSVFPPTTVANTTSILTGLYPSEHNWYGWNFYFKETDEVVSLFLNKVRTTGNIATKKVQDFDYMKTNSIIELINEKTNSKAYYVYPFTNDNPCFDLDMVCDRIESLCQNTDKKFIYGYIESPDNLMHIYGLSSNEVKLCVKEINEKIEALSKKLHNTLLIVVADHGLINSDNIFLYEDYSEISEMIERVSFELRCCGVKLKDNVNKKDFEEVFNRYFQKDFELLTPDEVIENDLFGPNGNDYLRQNIGDYLIVAKGEKTLIYDEFSKIFKANHAGNTMDEIMVPLIIIECK